MTEFPLPAYKLPFSYTGDLQATHTQDDVVQQSGVAQTIHTRRVTQGSGLKWQRQSAANIDGDGRPTGTYTLVGGTFAVTLTQTQHTAVGDFAGDCTRTGTAQLSAAAVGKNAVLTVNGYGDYGIDMDLSVLDLLIATTTMTCTFSNGDSSGPLPAGPEGGIVQFLNVNSVSWTPPDGLGVIAWSTATPRVLGTGKYSGSYVFIEDQ